MTGNSRKLRKTWLALAVAITAFLAIPSAKAETAAMVAAHESGVMVEATAPIFFYSDFNLDRSPVKPNPVAKASPGKQFCWISATDEQGYTVATDGKQLFGHTKASFKRVPGAQVGDCKALPSITEVATAADYDAAKAAMVTAREKAAVQAKRIAEERAAREAASEAKTPRGQSYFTSTVIEILAATVAFAILNRVYLKKITSPESRARQWALKKNDYFLDDASGEWKKIIRRGASGSVTVKKKTRNKRLLIEDQAVSVARFMVPGCLFFVFCFLAGAAYAGPLGGPVCGFLAAGMFLPTVIFVTHANNSIVIDPPPKRTANNPFGPNTLDGLFNGPLNPNISTMTEFAPIRPRTELSHEKLVEALELAKQGNASAQAQIGLIQYAGLAGVPANPAKGVEWLKKAAEQGDLHSQYTLGLALSSDRDGVPADWPASRNWLRKAAEQGNADAQYLVGAQYHLGTVGQKIDKAEAIRWYEKAASQGHPGATEDLATLKGVAPDRRTIQPAPASPSDPLAYKPNA